MTTWNTGNFSGSKKYSVWYFNDACMSLYICPNP